MSSGAGLEFIFPPPEPTPPGGPGWNFSVKKLSGEDGTLIWGTAIDGPRVGGLDQALALAIDSSGDVIASGHLIREFGISEFFVVRLAAVDGAGVWSRKIVTSGDGTAFAVGLDSAGDVIAAGSLDDSGTRRDFAIVKLAESGGSGLNRTSAAV